MNLTHLGVFIVTLLVSSTFAQHTSSNVTQKSDDNDLDEVIETILSSGRQGRNIDGLDDVYSDPSIKDALNSGDDAQARNLIKDKLCSLGLMQCDDAEGKRPYYSPDDLIYAQPIAIRPVGRPIPSVHIRGGPPQPPPNYSKYPSPSQHQGPYGAPKPMPVPIKGPINNYNGPPRKVGYSGPPVSKPYLNSLPFGSEGPVYFSKPPGPIYEGPVSPYEFVNPNKQSFDSSSSYSHSGSSFTGQQLHENKHHHDKPSFVSNSPVGPSLNGHGSGSGLQGEAVQQHVHHHFHHAEADIKVPLVVNNPIPIPVSVSHGNSINSNEYSSSGYQNSGINNQLSTNGFTPMSSQNGLGYYGKQQSNGVYSGINNSGLGPVNGVTGNGVYGSNYQSSSSLNSYNTNGLKPVSEGFQQLQSSLNNQGPPTFGSNGYDSFGANSQFSDSTSGSYNGNTNSFHSNNPDYYKKELNLNGGYKGNGLGQYATGSLYSVNNQYNQGEKYQSFETQRKENFDCVCVPYEQCQADDVIGRKDDLILPLDPRNINGKDIEAITDEQTSVNATKPIIRVTKDVLKAGTKVEDTKNEEVKKISKRDVSEKKSDTEQTEGEARLLGLGGLAGIGGGVGSKRVVPTFGVSFGLPYPNQGYPLNPYGPYPLPNPYFGSISPNGLNLGLVNVNPLVSFQVSKNEYGEKLLKPLVNLHVTPNENIIHKVGGLFKGKKHGYGGYGGGYGGGGLVNQHYHQHTHVAEPPAVYHPHHHHPEPHYSQPHYSHHGGQEFYPSSPYNPNGYGDYGHTDGYYREGGSSYESYPSGLSSEYSHEPPNSFYSRSANVSNQDQYLNYQSVYPQNTNKALNQNQNFANNIASQNNPNLTPNNYGTNNNERSKNVAFPNSRRKRDITTEIDETSTSDTEPNIKNIEISEARSSNPEKRQAFYNPNSQKPQFSTFQNQISQCGPRQVCCRRPNVPVQHQNRNQCGTRNSQGITGRIKNPVYVDGDSEFGEYPWQVALLKKDPKESVYACGGTLIDQYHIITAAHCIKSYKSHEVRARLGEWDVNHDVEFYPYIERDVVQITIHPEYYAGTLDNDIAILRLDRFVDYNQTPHISPACLPDKYSDYTGARCWTTGWGKDAFGDYGKYQNILKEVDVPIIGDAQCQQQLRNTRLGYNYKLNPGFICAGGEEGKDACKGDGGGPLVCERNGSWKLVGVVSWGIGCGQVNVPGVYVRVSHYLDWIQQVTQRF